MTTTNKKSLASKAQVNPSLAKAYARALTNICKEKNIDAAKELTQFIEVLNSSEDLELLLSLSMFSLEDKAHVLEEVLKRMDLSDLTSNFISFLLQEDRISLITQVYKEVVYFEDLESGFIAGTIEGAADSVDEDILTSIQKYLVDRLGKKTQLTYHKNPAVVAGFRVKVEDLLFDATARRQFDDFVGKQD